MSSRIRVAVAFLPVLCLLSLLNAGAQAPTAPPMIVQVPYISLGAGNIVSSASSTSKAAACTGYANAGLVNNGDGCPANQVGVSAPWGVAVDSWGNVYFADEGHAYVRVIYAGATTVNGVANPATAMIVAANTSLSTPAPLVAGDVYALAGGLAAAGGSGFTCNGGGTALSTNGSGCPATDSYIKGPYGPAVDGAGNVFIVDKSNSLVYVVIANASSKAAQLVTLENPTVTSPKVGSIYAIVNGGGGYVDGVLASGGKVHGPYGIAVDANENLYIADGTNNLVRMVNGPGVTNSSGTSGICASNSCAPGYIHAIAGLFATCTSTSCTALAAAPSANVPPLGTGFLAPMGIAVDSYGNIYIGDNSAGTNTVPATVRVIYAGGTNNPMASLICIENSSASYCGSTPSLTAGYVYTIAGNGVAGSTGKGAGLLATATGVAFDRLNGLVLDTRGNIYIMDYGTHSEVAEVNANTGILTFLSADGLPSSGAAYSGAGVYCSSGTATGSGPVTLDKYGDGCPAPQSYADNGEGNIGIDPSGNLYFADSSNNLVRKLTFNNSFPATTVGNPAATQNLAFVLFTGSTGSTVTSGTTAVSVSTQGITTGSEFANAGAGDSCSGSTTMAPFTGSSTNVANDVCIIPVTVTPAKAGARSGAVQITGTISGTRQPLGTVYLNGVGNGAEVAIDPGTNSTLGGGNEPVGVTTDSAGNAYVAYGNGTIYRTPNGGGTPVEIASGLTNPHQMAIDGAGDLYAADSESGGSGAGEIIAFAGASTSSGLISAKTLISGLNNPKGLAVDASGNLYIAEAGSVLFQPIGNGMPTQLGSGFTTPVSVAVDASGNVYVADTGLNEIEKLTIVNGAMTQQTPVTLLSGANPVSVAVDAAADIYYGDVSNGEVVEVPASGTTAAVATGFTTPAGIALDPAGNLYVADNSSVSGISFYQRNAAMLPAIPKSRTSNASLTNIGNVSYSGGIASNSDINVSTDFTFAAGSSNGCNSPASFTLTAAENCELAVTANTSTAIDTVTFTGGSTLTLSSAVSEVIGTSTTLNVNNPSVSYGTSITGTVTVTPNSGSLNPTGTVTLLANGVTTLGSCTLTNSTGNTSSCSYSLSNVSVGTPTLTASYSGDSNSGPSVSSGTLLNITQISTTTTLNVTNASIIEGSSFTGTALVSPTSAIGAISVYLDGSISVATSCVLSGGSCSWSLGDVALGSHTLTATYGGNANYAASSTANSTSISVLTPPQASAVATGDTRTVTEPVFPAVCTQLTATLTSVNDDLPTSVDASVTNPDGARIQAALNNCSANFPGQAVELSVDGANHNAFLTGPISMPSNVTLLVDPGVYVYFSRNAQDYDMVPGTHTCGTVNNNSATASCQALIDIPGTSTNVGIMGFGKLDGRGGDVLINAIPPYGGQSWWGLATIANSGGSQQNPRFIQMDTGSSNITMYKITLRNAPKFHVSTTGAVSGFTAWDVKIVTPTSSRNTDGIDPGNATNFTITRSWISDGDDNVAVGAAGTTAPAANISVTNNHFFAGHGESIGSYTGAGVSNILFDGNMLSGNGVAGAGSSINNTADSNSSGLRIKSGYDRGGLVTNIQYSNSCFQDHKAEIVFSPNYEATTGTSSPNFNNILFQNLTFLTAGTAQLTGTNNSGTVYPLQVTLDNVSFPSSYPSSEFSPAPTNASLTYGPGLVSANFVSDFATFVGANSNTATNNITVQSLFPPSCNFTYIAPELTGPNGTPQTIIQGQNATAVVILTPAVGGAAYPMGTVSLTDALSSNTMTVTLTGTTDTISIPLIGLTAGTHTFTATYSGDSNYPLTNGQTVYSTTAPYVITVNAGSLTSSTTGLNIMPTTTTYGNSVTATATVTGINPTGTIQFIVNGSVYTTVSLASGSASASISLPYSISSYTVYAVYSGDSANGGSMSTVVPVTITPALTNTSLSANVTTSSLGHPVSLTATVSSLNGVPTGTVNFTYSTTIGGTQISLGSATLSNGTASVSANLPLGTNYATATYLGVGSFGGSVSTYTTIIVNSPTIIPMSSNPIALPYTMTNIAGGGAAVPSSGNMACTGATDKYGDGCLATAIGFTASDDMRAVVADPFGNVYLSDISAALVRRIAPNGVITNFAGRITGTACVPTATSGCTPTLVTLGKARGVGTDNAGNIYIANYTGNQVFEVKVSNGLLYLVAGNGTAGSIGDGSAASSAEINSARGAWGDAVGNIYIADTANNKIRVVDPTGNIHTFAGTGTAASNGDGAAATSAAINNPQGVIADANLNAYIADSSGGRIRVVCVTCGTGSPLDALLGVLGITSPVNGNIYSIAGNGSTATYSYTAPVLATSVSMSPQKMAFDTAGNLYISDGNNAIWFLDFHTGYLRAIANNAASVCGNATDSYGDGCPATQAKFGSNGGNGIGVGADTLGNIYISDSTNGLIRKVITGLASPATATTATAAQPVQLHFAAGDTKASSNALAYSSSEWTLGTPTCTINGDTTSDCLFTSSFKPAVPGARSTALTVNSFLGSHANLGLTGTGLGAGATLNPASQINFGTNLSVAGLATDNAGNVYVSDATSKKVLRFASSALTQGTSATATTLITLNAPGPIAVDPRGYVYAADSSTGLITQITPSGAASTLPFNFTAPAGLAVDALNNLYVTDSSAQAVYQINPITGVGHNLNLGALVSPKGLTIDPAGNLLVADSGVPAIYRFNPNGMRTTVATSATAPSAVLTDAAGNLLIADTAAILAVPASSNSSAFTVAGIAPSALAIDSAGNLFTGSNGGVLKLIRTQGYVQFASSSAPPQTASVLESGNQVLQVTSATQSDKTDYSLTPNASTDCVLGSGSSAILAIGGVCTLTASYTPTTYVTTTDTVTFNGNLVNAALSTPSSVQLVLTGPATAPASSITLNAFSPASPNYGQTVTASATVTGASLMPTGTVVFTVDSSTINANVVNSVATVSLTNLGAGSHSVSAVYTSSNGYAPATSTVSNLVVNKVLLTVTADNTSREVGAANPTFTASYSGFINGDTSAVLGGSSLLTTTATTSSPAGLYPITAAQGTLTTANYAFTFVNGTLSVVQAPSVSMTTSSTLAGSHSNGYTLTITVQNTGASAIPNVVLTAATLGTSSGTVLPQTWGTIPVGGLATFTVHFPGSIGADGAGLAEKYSGTYTGGSFSTSLRSVILP